MDMGITFPPPHFSVSTIELPIDLSGHQPTNAYTQVSPTSFTTRHVRLYP